MPSVIRPPIGALSPQLEQTTPVHEPSPLGAAHGTSPGDALSTTDGRSPSLGAPMRPRSILIVGGGIAGLTAARALDRDGHSVRIVERAEAFGAVGAGIVLQGNALAILDTVGLGGAVREAGQSTGTGGIFTSTGEALMQVDRAALGAMPLVRDIASFYRPELHAVLARAVAALPTHLGSELASLEHRPHGARVELSDGWAGEVDVVVGADGIHSRVRSLALGAATPGVRYAGYRCWRAIAPNRVGVERVSEAWGSGQRIGLVPLTRERVYAFMVFNAPSGSPATTGASSPLDEVRGAFGAFRGDAGAFLASLSERDALMQHDIDELDRVVWGRGRVVLIGDAAHAMTPNLGQGAAQGIEDAAALACLLREQDDDAELATALERLRHARVTLVKRRSELMGRVGQWESALARRARNWALRLSPAKRSVASIEELLAPGAALGARLAKPRAANLPEPRSASTSATTSPPQESS